MQPQPVPSPEDAEDGKEKNMSTSYNYSKLRGRMAEKGVTQRELAKNIGMESVTLSKSLTGLRLFRVNEVDRIAEVLDIQPAEMGDYFFTRKVA